MKMQPMLEELESAAEKLGVKVSYEPLAETVGGGGLCRVKGSYRVIIDKRGTVQDKVLTLARALAGLDGVAPALSPAAQKLVERYQHQRAS